MAKNSASPNPRGRPRNSTGRVSAITCESIRKQEDAIAQARRQAIVGEKADPVLSTRPIDIMFARKVITQENLQAADWYLRLDRYRYGACHRLKSALDDSRGGTPFESPRMDAEYWVLNNNPSLTNQVLASIQDVIVFETSPRWLAVLVCSGGKLDSKSEMQKRDFVKDIGILTRIWLDCGRKSDDDIIALRNSLMAQRAASSRNHRGQR